MYFTIVHEKPLQFNYVVPFTARIVMIIKIHIKLLQTLDSWASPENSAAQFKYNVNIPLSCTIYVRVVAVVENRRLENP